MKGLKKYLLSIVLIFVFTTKQAQTISQIPVFSYTTSFSSLGKISAMVEDTLTNQLHIQNSCNCGVGPANQWNALSHVNTGSYLIKTPFVYYGPSGTLYHSKGMNFFNGRINTYDNKIIYGFNSSNYAQLWNHSAGMMEDIEITEQHKDSLFVIKESGLSCKYISLLNAVNGSVMTFNSLSCSGTKGYLLGDVKTAKVYMGKLYLGGKYYVMDQFSNILDSNLVAIKLNNGDVEILNYMCNDTISDIEFHRGKMHLSGNFTSVKGQSRGHYAMLDMLGNLQSGTPAFNAMVNKIDVYDDYLFALGKYTHINSVLVNSTGDYVLKAIRLNGNMLMNWNMSFTNSAQSSDDYLLEIYRNKLFVTSRISTPHYVDGFCLPPIKTTTAITSVTTSFCEGSNGVAFSVPGFLYANTYSWLYTGTGATLTPNTNSLTVNFANGATAGKIKVFANSACGSKSDTLSLSISILPKPNAIASLVDDTLNCFKPKVPLLGNSFTPNVSYQWGGPSGYFSTNKNDSTAKYLPGIYTVTVTSNVTGCKNTANVLVRLDTLKPNVILPSGPYIIPCSPNYLILNGASTTSPSFLQWKNVLSSTLKPNPDSVKVSGNYVLMVQSLYNGCKNSDTITVTSSTAVPTVTITSHSNYVNGMTPLDSISCFTPSVQINVAYNPPNCNVYWRSVATNSLYSNPITVNSQGYYVPVVVRLDNNCADSSKIVFIKQNLSVPFVLITSASPAINCSYSTATLNAVYSPTNSVVNWTGPSSFNSSNPAIVSQQGKYCFNATNPQSGCTKKDSVWVGQSNTLVVNAGRDTTICKGSVVSFTAAVAGTVSPIAYSWSTGSASQTLTQAYITSTAIAVSVNGGGCNGTDTVEVTIPDDIQDSIITSKGCTGNSGTIVIYAKGGIPPYRYSVNGSVYSVVSTYNNMSFGTHTVSIKDSLGCTRTVTTSINQNSSSIQPVFIASTQNFKGDTVVLVDITLPKADSIGWILPGIATIIGGDMYSTVVIFGDTGTFAVTMEAYYSNCMISTTKNIRILPFDTAYASFLNNNGIKLLSVNPNPNNGQFAVQAEFYKKQNASLQIWDATGQKQYQQNFSDALLINLPLSLPALPNGTYILRLIGEYSSKHFNFVINN